MTIKIYKILLFILSTVVYSCTNNKDKSFDKISNNKIIQIQPRQKYLLGEINDFLKTIRPKNLLFSVNGNQDTIIVSKNGTYLYIPKGTFINSNGKEINGLIDIELIEALNVADFILNDLQTESNDQILESGGMLFLDATYSNKPLKIKADKQINIELKTSHLNPKMKLFKGEILDNSLNWTNPKPLESNYLISIPFELLEFNLCGGECHFNEKHISKMKNIKNQDTYISTREFEQRMCYLAYLACDENTNLSNDILDLYIKNKKEDLHFADRMIVEYFKTNHSNLIDTNYIKDGFKFDDKGWTTLMYLSFLEFSKQRFTKPLSIDGIDFSKKISRQILQTKGFNESEIDLIISYCKMRDRVISDKKDEVQSKNIASYNFKVNELGWINVDAFLNDSSCKESNFEVEINQENPKNSIQVVLAIPKRKIVVSFISNKDNRYSFTKKIDGYRKLPIGEKAFVIAIGIKNGLPLFASKEIKIPRSGNISLDLKPLEKESIQRKIKEMASHK